MCASVRICVSVYTNINHQTLLLILITISRNEKEQSTILKILIPDDEHSQNAISTNRSIVVPSVIYYCNLLMCIFWQCSFHRALHSTMIFLLFVFWLIWAKELDARVEFTWRCLHNLLALYIIAASTRAAVKAKREQKVIYLMIMTTNMFSMPSWNCMHV